MNRKPNMLVHQRKPRPPVEGSFCQYSHRSCMHNRLEGYEFCLKHIQEDKNSPYKQCSYTSSKSGKRCQNAAPKQERKEGLCLEHAKRSIAMRHQAHQKRKPKESAETLLEGLDHFKLCPGSDGIFEHKRLKTSADNVANKALEYATSSDSEDDSLLVDQAWRGDADSDAESIDSDQEDLLKYAGVYTAEEVALIMRDKLIRLQSLYIDQFKRLQHIMKEKRRKYLHTHKQEREALGSIKYYKNQPESREEYFKLKALKRYHKRHGKEALLHRQSKQRRIAVSEGPNYRPPSFPKCIHIEDDTAVKCTDRAMPLTKYCFNHILEDPYQTLYRACQFGGGTCGMPAFSLEEDVFCNLHVPLKQMEPRVSLKMEEQGEELTKEALDMLLPQLNFTPNEIMHRQLLTQNPQMPDTIFSDLGDVDSEEALKHSNDSNQSFKSSSSSSLPSSSRQNLPSDIAEKPKPKYGPLLLQHLKGTVNLSNYRDSYQATETTVTNSSTSTSDLGDKVTDSEGQEVAPTQNADSNSATDSSNSLPNGNGNLEGNETQNGDDQVIDITEDTDIDINGN
ncbi:hypothetical protein FSP39_002442 [Pinctada imbricata]|uniref:KAT8 regulatory NSL complex subunit 2 n=1 Tax=Pinctada imbricata TaxID=66713 RepID=A0AA89CCG3_PINIB|nr:hypothetical protein FSP39_002442 [Pinctada imbricata]